MPVIKHFAGTKLKSSCFTTIEGVHVMSYQTDFASHRTFDRRVGFLLAWRGIGKNKKMPRNFVLFSSYHNTKHQPSDNNISTRTHMKF